MSAPLRELVLRMLMQVVDEVSPGAAESDGGGQ
jgi:hypothetical protein